MKQYFLRLFDYDHYANKVMLGLINKTGNPETAIKLMAHLLASQQVWLYRCAGSVGEAPAIWPEGKPEHFAESINQLKNMSIAFLNGLTDEDFEKQIEYKNSRGDVFSNRLSDILAHVINHGTHHRAQIGQLVKGEGIDLPFTDYIIYLRSLKS